MTNKLPLLSQKVGLHKNSKVGDFASRADPLEAEVFSVGNIFFGHRCLSLKRNVSVSNKKHFVTIFERAVQIFYLI